MVFDEFYLDFEHDLLFRGGVLLCSLTKFKERAMLDHPGVVEEFRIKSKLTNSASLEVEKMVNWTEVILKILK